MTGHARNSHLRRATGAAWTVFLSMAATTMTFQVYHAIKYGQMPWPLAVLEGIVPLAISIGVLEFVAEWEAAPWWGTWAAYMITAGSMYLSAAATGSVVLHAAPPHMSGLFGALLDAAALLAIRFILTGPRAARERAAREADARAAAERAEAGELTRLRRALESERAAHQQGMRAAQEEARRAVGAAEDARQAAEIAREDAGREAAQSEARAAQLARKLDRAAGAQGTRNGGTAKRAGGTQAKPETGVPDDVDARAEALSVLADEPGISGAQLGLRVGMSKRWGQDFRKSLAQTAPQDVVPDAGHVPDGERPE